MSNYLKSLTLVAGLLAANAAWAQQPSGPAPPAAFGGVELAQYHYGHWDVYYLWYGQPILYGSFASHELADHYVLYLTQNYHVQAWHVYHY